HAIVERHGRIVPRRAVVLLRVLTWRRREIEDARQQRRRLLGRKGGHIPFDREQPGEQAVEPDPLFRGERRALRYERRQRWTRRHAHGAVSLSIRDRSASTWCRRVKERKLSCGEPRCAR